MTEQLTEEEQVEQLKKWWKENGTAVITGIVIGLAGVIGVRYWFTYQENQAIEASVLYSGYMEAIEKKDAERAAQDSKKLLDEYKGTSYASLAAMQDAKQAIENSKPEEAAKKLAWAVANPGHDALEHLARVRLARVLVNQKQYDDALKLVKDQKEPAFAASYAELRGDIYRAMDKPEMARTEYESALSSDKLSGKQREFVEMKLNDLGFAGNTVASTPAR